MIFKAGDENIEFWGLLWQHREGERGAVIDQDLAVTIENLAANISLWDDTNSIAFRKICVTLALDDL
jgi:hypothetical protein